MRKPLIACGFARIGPIFMLKALATYFCKVGRDLGEIFSAAKWEPPADVLYVKFYFLSFALRTGAEESSTFISNPHAR